jgi:hypothetical protein
MRSLPRLALGALAAAALAAAACSGISSPSSNTNQDFVSIPLSSLFGTINVHEFDVNKSSGEAVFTITALSPTPDAVLGLALGLTSGSGVDKVCLPTLGTTLNARLNQIAMQVAIQRGHYCVEVFAVSALTVDQTYTLRVSHP